MVLRKKFFEKDDLKEFYLPIGFGAALIALGQNLFVMPSGLLAGGLSGIALIVNYSLGISAGLAFFILNIPMVILALKKLSLRFTVQSFFAVLIFTVVQMSTASLIGVLNVDDFILNSIFGGLLRGIGAGIIFRNGVTLMGFDVLAFLAKKNLNINIGTFNMMLDSMILVVAAFMFGFEMALYTIISQYVVAKISDGIMQGVGERKNIMIVTKEYERIRDEIYKSVNRGVTFIEAEGGFSREPKKIVFVVVTNRQITKIREIMEAIDKDAFMTITDSSEVKGKGFRSLGQ